MWVVDIIFNQGKISAALLTDCCEKRNVDMHLEGYGLIAFKCELCNHFI